MPYDLETKAVLKQLNSANRQLAELKGIARTIPNEQILIATLPLQEAWESSAVENIVTTQDELYRAESVSSPSYSNSATKEVLRYREALLRGFELVRKDRLLTNNSIKELWGILMEREPGFLATPNKRLERNDGVLVYTPPQDIEQIVKLMGNLERFINDASLSELDPLIKMAIIHHQFESIHPFGDGNGRTGRIICVLYLVVANLLELPILYLSRYITRNKSEYYRLLQAVRDKDGNNAQEWEAWILYILIAVEETAKETICLVKGIAQLMQQYKQQLRPLLGKSYKHELLNNLFSHPYTKIEYVAQAMGVNRVTATKYLKQIVNENLLEKEKIGRANYYTNKALLDLLQKSFAKEEELTYSKKSDS